MTTTMTDFQIIQEAEKRFVSLKYYSKEYIESLCNDDEVISMEQFKGFQKFSREHALHDDRYYEDIHERQQDLWDEYVKECGEDVAGEQDQDHDQEEIEIAVVEEMRKRFILCQYFPKDYIETLCNDGDVMSRKYFEGFIKFSKEREGHQADMDQRQCHLWDTYIEKE